MTHRCPVKRCHWQIPDHLLMCAPHWHMVPPALQAAVWATYNHGAGIGTAELVEAQQDAIDAVNGKLANTTA